jgi:phosphopantothenoylcysteine synthetase/decarboxylase
VTLLGSAEACLRATTSPALSLLEYRSTRDLMQLMLTFIQAHPDAIVVHAAAVGDYEIADAGQGKIPSGSDELILRFTPTPKIVDHLRAESDAIRLVSFKAAAPETSDEQLVAIASRQRGRTDSDLVFANVIGRLSSRVLLLGEQPEWHATRSGALSSLIETLQRWQSAG